MNKELRDYLDRSHRRDHAYAATLCLSVIALTVALSALAVSMGAN